MLPSGSTKKTARNATLGDWLCLCRCMGGVIEDDAFIGSGVIIIAGIKVGKGASVEAGSVGVEDVPAKGRVFGSPAEKV